jgi:hypothetical protein
MDVDMKGNIISLAQAVKDKFKEKLEMAKFIRQK